MYSNSFILSDDLRKEITGMKEHKANNIYPVYKNLWKKNKAEYLEKLKNKEEEVILVEGSQCTTVDAYNVNFKGKILKVLKRSTKSVSIIIEDFDKIFIEEVQALITINKEYYKFFNEKISSDISNGLKRLISNDFEEDGIYEKYCYALNNGIQRDFELANTLNRKVKFVLVIPKPSKPKAGVYFVPEKPNVVYRSLAKWREIKYAFYEGALNEFLKIHYLDASTISTLTTFKNVTNLENLCICNGHIFRITNAEKLLCYENENKIKEFSSYIEKMSEYYNKRGICLDFAFIYTNDNVKEFRTFKNALKITNMHSCDI